MDSTYYPVTTNWVILAAIVIAFFHWRFGEQNFLPSDLSGGVFYSIILGGTTAVLAILYFTSSSIFGNLSQVDLQLVQGIRVFIGGGF